MVSKVSRKKVDLHPLSPSYHLSTCHLHNLLSELRGKRVTRPTSPDPPKKLPAGAHANVKKASAAARGAAAAKKQKGATPKTRADAAVRLWCGGLLGGGALVLLLVLLLELIGLVAPVATGRAAVGVGRRADLGVCATIAPVVGLSPSIDFVPVDDGNKSMFGTADRVDVVVGGIVVAPFAVGTSTATGDVARPPLPRPRPPSARVRA